MGDREWLALHARLVAGDPTASRELVHTGAPRIVSALRRRYGYLPREDLEDSANDALLYLLADPTQYHPERGSLLNFLTTVALHKLTDRVRKAYRRREIPVGGIVELEQCAANNPVESPSQLGHAPRCTQEIEALLAEVLPDARDRRVWEIVCAGRAAISEMAAVLDLGHLPLKEQQMQVKRHRDRVVRRVRRRRDEFRRYLL